MSIRKVILLITCICFTPFIAFCQKEAMKDVVNNLAFYYKKSDLKYLSEAKKSVDNSFKTHSDSLNITRNVYKAVVYSSLLYVDSLNKLNQPDTLLLQTTKLINRLLGNRKIYRFNIEMNYAKGCIANVYQRKAFNNYYKNNYGLAILNFKIAKNYVPAARQLDAYLANIYYRLGNYVLAKNYYDTLLVADKPKLADIQSASNVYKTLGDTATTLHLIQRGLDIYPHDKYLLFEEANIYNNKRNYVLLKPLLNYLIETTPNDPNIIFMAANCSDHLNEWGRAEPLYQKAIELNGADYTPIFNLGLLYLKKAVLKKSDNQEYQVNINNSKKYLEKANEMAPNTEKCLIALQMLYLQTNNTIQLKKVNTKLKQLTNY